MPILGISFAYIHKSCVFTWPIWIYVFISIIIGSLAFLNELIILTLSLSGTVSDSSRRRHVAKFSHAQVFLLLLEICVQCYGVFATFGPPSKDFSCTSNLTFYSLPLIQMVAMWGLVTNFGFFTILLILVRFSKKKSKMHDFQKYVINFIWIIWLVKITTSTITISWLIVLLLWISWFVEWSNKYSYYFNK